MTEGLLNRLDRETRALIEEFRLEPNARVSTLAARLGLRVELADLDDGNGGHLVVDPASTSGYKIVVNKRDPIYRQRWTTAHEIGHYLLHMRGPDVFPTPPIKHRDQNALSNIYFDDEIREEREANAFAELILIPFSILRKIIAKGEDNDQRIAEILNVSADAVRISRAKLNRSELKNPRNRARGYR